MMIMWNDIYKSLNEYLKLSTYPVGVKLLRSIREIKEDVRIRKPRVKLSVCQVIGLSRIYGWNIVASISDMTCIYGAIALGLIDPPSDIKNGKVAYEGGAYKTMEAGEKAFKNMYRVKDRYEGFEAGPIHELYFDPDIILIYGNSAQINRLIHSLTWGNGERLEFSSIGEYACADYIAYPIITGKAHITLPCYGDRRFGHSQFDEIVFSIPINKINDLIEGLKKLHEVGYRYPTLYYGILVQTSKTAYPKAFPKGYYVEDYVTV